MESVKLFQVSSASPSTVSLRHRWSYAFRSTRRPFPAVSAPAPSSPCTSSCLGCRRSRTARGNHVAPVPSSSSVLPTAVLVLPETVFSSHPFESAPLRTNRIRRALCTCRASVSPSSPGFGRSPAKGKELDCNCNCDHKFI